MPLRWWFIDSLLRLSITNAGTRDGAMWGGCSRWPGQARYKPTLSGARRTVKKIRFSVTRLTDLRRPNISAACVVSLLVTVSELALITGRASDGSIVFSNFYQHDN